MITTPADLGGMCAGIVAYGAACMLVGGVLGFLLGGR